MKKNGNETTQGPGKGQQENGQQQRAGYKEQWSLTMSNCFVFSSWYWIAELYQWMR